MRKRMGGNRHTLKFANHSHKSVAKRRRMGWGKKSKLDK